MNVAAVIVGSVAIGVIIDRLVAALRAQPKVLMIDIDSDESEIRKIEIIVAGTPRVEGLALTDADGERTVVSGFGATEWEADEPKRAA